MAFTRNITSLVLRFIEIFTATQTFILIAYLLNVIAVHALLEEEKKRNLGNQGKQERKSLSSSRVENQLFRVNMGLCQEKNTSCVINS